MWRQHQLKVPNPQDASTVTQGFTYDAWGNRTSVSTTYGGATPVLKEGLSWSTAYTDGRNSLPTSVITSGGSLPTGVSYDDLGRMSQVYGVPGQTSTQMTWIYDAAGRVAKENGTSFLLDGGGLRFRRTHTDGSLQYTVYGFHGEPLSVFTQAPATTTMTMTRTSSSKVATTQSIGPPPPPTGVTLTSPASGTNVATGATVTFTATSSTTGAMFTWQFGDGTTVTGATATHAYTSAGTYTVSVTANAAYHSSSVATITLGVVAPVSVSMFTSSPSTITLGQSTTLPSSSLFNGLNG